MPQNYFITGLPKAGKTALLRRLIKSLKARGLKVGGLITPDESHHGTRTGFYVKDVASGKIARLADVDADGPKVSKYHVDVKSFEGIAMPALKSFPSCDVIFIDEIGPMELKSAKFSDILDEILESGTPVIASLHVDLAPKYGFYGEVMLLADSNREAVYNELAGRLKDLGKKAAKAKPATKKEAKKKAGAPKKAAKARPEKKSAPKKAAKAGAKPVKKAEAKRPAEKAGKQAKKGGGLFDRLKGLLHG